MFLQCESMGQRLAGRHVMTSPGEDGCVGVDSSDGLGWVGVGEAEGMADRVDGGGLFGRGDVVEVMDAVANCRSLRARRGLQAALAL